MIIIQREDGQYVRRGDPSHTPDITEASVYLTVGAARSSSAYRDCCKRRWDYAHSYIVVGDDGKRIFNGRILRVTKIETEEL